MQVKIKLTKEASALYKNAPSYIKKGDAGIDLVAINRTWHSDDIREYDTGISIEIPEGFVGLVFPRSSISNTQLSLTNSVGVIDSNYRGTIKLRFLQRGYIDYEIGQRIGQIIIIPYPKIEFKIVDELSSTNREEGAFGSTGK